MISHFLCEILNLIFAQLDDAEFMLELNSPGLDTSDSTGLDWPELALELNSAGLDAPEFMVSDG